MLLGLALATQHPAGLGYAVVLRKCFSTNPALPVTKARVQPPVAGLPVPPERGSDAGVARTGVIHHTLLRPQI